MQNVKNRPASEKQIAFIGRLVASKDLSSLPENMQDELRQIADESHDDMPDVRKASEIIDHLLGLPDPVDPDAVNEPGMYRNSDGIFRVQESQIGRLYAKELTNEGLVYAPGAVRRLKASDRMSVEDAAATGAELHRCIVCAAELTDPKSIARGIGPVCAGRV